MTWKKKPCLHFDIQPMEQGEEVKVLLKRNQLCYHDSEQNNVYLYMYIDLSTLYCTATNVQLLSDTTSILKTELIL
jgi:hypothetical protein